MLPRRRSHWTHNGNSEATAISRFTRSSLNTSIDRQAGFSSSRWRGASSSFSSCLYSRARSSHVKIRFSEARRVSPFVTRVNTWRLNKRNTFIITVRITRAQRSADDETLSIITILDEFSSVFSLFRANSYSESRQRFVDKSSSELASRWFTVRGRETANSPRRNRKEFRPKAKTFFSARIPLMEKRNRLPRIFLRTNAHENSKRRHAPRSRTDAALGCLKVPQVRRQVGTRRKGAAGPLLSLSRPVPPHPASYGQGLWRTNGIQAFSSTSWGRAEAPLLNPMISLRGPGPLEVPYFIDEEETLIRV